MAVLLWWVEGVRLLLAEAQQVSLAEELLEWLGVEAPAWLVADQLV